MSSSSISTPKQKGNLYLASSLCDGLEDNDLRQVTTLLKNKDADPNVLMPLHGITPFHLVIGNDSEAFAEEVTKLFLRHGGNPNVKSIDGMTPVHVAAAWGRAKILDLLLANGGDPLCLDSDSCSPFHYAFQGEHFEAVAVLSKYCINNEEDDDKPHFKRELDKVLVNNGDVLAEYMVSDESLFDSSFKNFSYSSINEDSKSDTSGYHPENSTKDALSLNNNFVTTRRKQQTKIKQEEIDNIHNNNKYMSSFDFKRETVEEERSLISEIISQLSSSITSEVEVSNSMGKNDEDESMSNCKTSSPRRKEIKMTFNRPIKCGNSKIPEKQPANKRSSTLHVIKQHNHLPHLINTRILTNNLKKPSSTNLDKKLAVKKNIHPATRKLTPSKPKHQNKDNVSQLNKWLNETIISKSPNLVIDTYGEDKKRKFFKTPCFEKKSSPKYTKLSQKSPAVTPSKTRIKSPNKPNNVTPTSRIPRPKKYFTTPTHMKTVKRSIETPTRTVIPNKRKPQSSKRTATSEKPKTPLNNTYSKSEASTPSAPTDTGNTPKTAFKKENFRSIAVNLDDLMYDNDAEDLFNDRMSNSSIIAQSKKPASKYVSTFEKELAKILPGSEFVSGVGMLDSGASSKSESKLISSMNKEESRLFSQNDDNDLNRAIFDSATSSECKEDNLNTGNIKSKHSDMTNNGNDSLLCSKGSTSPNSNSSDSYLSLSKRDDRQEAAKDIETEKDINFKVQSISPESDFISLRDDSSSSLYRKVDSETFISVDEEYKYEDSEEGVVFLERRLCVSPPCASSDINTSFYSCSTTKSEPLPREMFLLDNITLRERLRNLGENPGPITKTTHHLYLKRLHRLESQGRKHIRRIEAKKTQSRGSVNFENEKELLKSSLLSIEWIKNLDDYDALEQKVFQEFVDPNPSRKWREGTTKSSFNYLLLDPRITKDLPRRAPNLSMSEKWEIFLSAIFYVGKGKRSRPYAHLYDAFKIWVSKDEQSVPSKKIQRILDIWNEDRGVIVLHVFQNTIPVEAYTREAMMIEVLGTQKLGNCKAGDYYGVVSTWRSKEKCELGRYLLFKSLQIMLLEGERQIFPQNL
ncbi:hypothetical protein TSAR_016378 [Trichomalopsis sarcophagae]|uniref:LEM domain-containing protein n=1 Tax=Trichomalopsis sarcophagae TaxID=543379 RepID=A0A232F3L6_9HYME|nr:hypothetical protein TSAR_016378 [Trichomalopsis sarcophagae]